MSSHSSQDGLQLLAGVVFRWRTLAITLMLASLAVAASVGASYLAKPRYSATAVVLPSASAGPVSGLARLASDLGGLGGIGGLGSLGSGEQTIAREMLTSRAVLEELVERFGLVPILFADGMSATPGDAGPAGERGPSMGDAIELLERKVRRVSVDRQTGAFRVTMRWHDPAAAAQWANALVDIVNDRARAQAIDEARRSIELLTMELQSTENVDLRATISALIGSHIRGMTLARSRDNFALRVVDPAVAPDQDKYYFPNRRLIALAAAVSATFATLLWLVVAAIRRDDAPPASSLD